MRRPRTTSTRLVAALTALVTVWCLGCSAFDPLVEHLFGHGSRMVCASEGGSSMGGPMRGADSQASGSASSVSQDRGLNSVATAQDHGDSGVSCGCQSCNAAASVTLLAVVPPAIEPQAHHWRAPGLLELERAPLLPPPQSVL